MVAKFWNSCFPESKKPHVHRHNFYLCQWQRNTQVRIIYLLYRWLVAILFLAVLACSILDIGREDREEPMYPNHYSKWWIYLTNWGLLFCTIQAWLAAWIVTQGLMVIREEFELIRQSKKSRLHRMYWVLYTLATVYSFIVTICYWAFVYDPEYHKLDTINLMVHVLNSVLMLFDLTIVGHPIKMSHAYYTTGVGLTYAVFTLIYYLAGGTDRRDQNSIYPLLDWGRPGKTIVACVAGIFFVFIVHLLCFLMYRVRVWIYSKLCVRSHDDDKEVTSIARTLSTLEESQRENFLNPTKIIDLKV